MTTDRDKVINGDLLIPSWIRVLVCIHSHKTLSVTAISKNTNKTYSYASLMVKQLRRLRFIDCVVDGRKLNCSLTAKGSELSVSLMTAIPSLSNEVNYYGSS